MNKFNSFFIAFTLIFVSFTPVIPMVVKMLFFFVAVVMSLSYEITISKLEGLMFFPFIFFVLFGFYSDLYFYGEEYASPIGMYFIFCIMVGFLCAKCEIAFDVIFYVKKIIFFFAAISLLGCIIIFFFPTLINHLVDYTYYHTSHKTLILVNFLLVDGLIVERNTGFASEPGMFQFLLNIGLVLHLMLSKKESKFYLTKVLVYFAAILTTNSTVGVFCFIVTIVYFFLEVRLMYKLLIVVVLAFAIPLLSEFFYYHVTVKLDVEGASFLGRFLPALNIFNDHITLYGKGNTFYDANNKLLNIGSYDTYTQMLVRFGIVGFVLYSFLISSNFKNNAVLLFVVLISFFGQALWFFPICIFLAYTDTRRLKEEVFIHGK